MLIVLLFACGPDHQGYSTVSSINVEIDVTGIPDGERPNGDVFTLERANVVLYSIRFPECEALSRSMSFFFPVAHAGHSDVNIPSNWNRPTVLDLLEPTPLMVQYHIPEQSMCFAASTFARWDESTLNLPVDEELGEAYSIELLGSCSTLSGEEHTFIIQTAVPSERIEPLSGQHQSPDIDTLKYRIVFDTTDLLNKIECRAETFDDSSPAGLQALTNLQNNALRSWEWE